MSYANPSAAASGLVGCPRCRTLHPIDTRACSVCRHALHPRHPQSLQRSIAYLATAAICYYPANALPIMQTTQLGRTTDSTILQGVWLLWELGSYPTALVIFVASVFVPLLKILALGWLCFSVVRGHPIRRKRRSVMYHIVEAIGTWSMVDVFVVALLVALVSISGLLVIAPGPAALAFCGVVVFTILSAQQFDTRLIWDQGTLHD